METPEAVYCDDQSVFEDDYDLYSPQNIFNNDSVHMYSSRNFSISIFWRALAHIHMKKYIEPLSGGSKWHSKEECCIIWTSAQLTLPKSMILRLSTSTYRSFSTVSDLAI